MEPIREGNRQMNRHPHRKVAGVAFLLALVALGRAYAEGILKPVYLGNPTPKTDVLGRMLKGSWADDPAVCARVEIRQARSNDAIILPPDTATGEGNEPFNPLLLVSRMGENVIGVNPGQFSVTLTNRFPTTNSYFVRVYDKSTPAASLYYANSVVFEDVPPPQQNQESTINVVFQGWQRVNGEADVDSDGDGIPDAMEGELGTSPSQKDTDGDGYNDLFEALHSDFVSPTEPNVPLEVALKQVGSSERGVSWGANPGLEYRLEVRPQWVDEETYTELWSGTAAETNLEHSVESWMQTNAPQGFFRVVVP